MSHCVIASVKEAKSSSRQEQGPGTPQDGGLSSVQFRAREPTWIGNEMQNTPQSMEGMSLEKEHQDSNLGFDRLALAARKGLVLGCSAQCRTYESQVLVS